METIPVKPIECESRHVVCPLSSSLLHRMRTILVESATTEVQVKMLKRPADMLPYFCVVAINTVAEARPESLPDSESLTKMTIDEFVHFMAELTHLNVDVFAHLIQRVFTLYGYEEQSLNDW